MNVIPLSVSELLFLGILIRRGESSLSTLAKDYSATTDRLTGKNYPSVYIIAEALKKAGLIAVVKSSSSKLTRYQITKPGTAALTDNIKVFITDSREYADEFRVALTLADFINKNETIELLAMRKNNLLERFESLKEVPGEIRELKYYYKSFYKYPKQIIELETKFINDIIKELKAENEIQLNLLINDE